MLFTPPLPQRKLQAIDTIGFGIVQKLFLVYENPFWDSNTTSIITLHIDGCGKVVGNNKLFQNLHTFQPHPWSPNILVGWLSGEGPELTNSLKDADLIGKITSHFRRLMPNRKIERPSKMIRTKWLNDDLFRGSYTYITPEAINLLKDPFDVLSSPVYHRKRARILFAGEGTHSRMYQTTIGAFLSGVREAERISNYIGSDGRKFC
jgi:monoamine oxidase